jgi:hypothetical protein
MRNLACRYSGRVPASRLPVVPPDAHSMNRPASPEAHPRRGAGRSVPITYEDHLVVPDALATTIKTTSPAAWRCTLAWCWPATASEAGAVAYIYDLRLYTTSGRDVLRDLLVPLPGFRSADPAPCPATQSERGRSSLRSQARRSCRVCAADCGAGRTRGRAQIPEFWRSWPAQVIGLARCRVNLVGWGGLRGG